MEEKTTGELRPAPPKGFVYTDIGLRDLRVKQKYDIQMKLYSPCSCGSGKKFKFCCNGKQMVIINTGE